MMLRRWMLAIVMVVALAPAMSAWAQHEEHAADTGHAAPHAAAAESEHGGGPAPSLVPDPTRSETWYSALWVVIIFVVLLVVLYFTAWKGVLRGLEQREKRIRGNIAEAETARAKAEETLRKYNQQLADAENRVREMISGAVAEGEKMAADVRARGQKEAEEIKDRASKDIDAARKQAVADFHAEAANLATQVAEKILRRNLNVDDQRDLVNQSLQQLDTINQG